MILRPIPRPTTARPFRARHLMTAAAGAVLLVARPAHASAVAPPRDADSTRRAESAAPQVITARQLRRACLRLWTDAAAEAANAALLRYCEAEIDEDPGESLRLADAAAIARIPEVAEALPEAAWLGYRGKVHPKEALIFQDAQKAGGPLLGAGYANVQSALIWGLAEFVAGKAKEQVDVYLVQRFVGRICNDADGRRMLPSTCTQLGTAESAIDAIRMPSLLRTAARADATVAPVVFTHLVLDRNPALLATHLDQAASGEMVMAGLFATIAGKPWEQALAAMASNEMVAVRKPLPVESAPVASMLYLAGLLGRTLDMPVKDMTAEFGGDRYGALWAQRAMLVNLKLGRPFPAPTLAGRAIWECSGVPAGNPYCPLAAGSRAAFRMFESSERVAASVDGVKAAGDDARLRAKALGTLASHVMAELRTLGAMSSTSAAAARLASTWNQAQEIARAYSGSEHVTAVTLLLQLPDSMGLMPNVPPVAVRGLTFTAALADADSASEVAATLNTLVAGSRTYAYKRTKENGFSIGVNAYAGANAGWETVVRAGAAKSKAAGFAGAFVPLGLELAWPTRFGFVRSSSILLQAIDVGALTSWRLQSSGDVDQEPRVTASQVFSPGVHAVFGFSGMPLSLGVGVSIAPRIRQVNSNGISEQKSALRIPVFLAMDIPLFP